MHRMRVCTFIRASVATCFDLARSVDAHVQSAGRTGERVVGGRRSGLLELGEEVTWEGRHFGVVQRMSIRITAFRPPSFFQDRMTKGAFRFLEHDHVFEAAEGGTMMIDVMRFEAPYGAVGWVAERLVLGPYLRGFLIARGKALKGMAEKSAEG